MSNKQEKLPNIIRHIPSNERTWQASITNKAAKTYFINIIFPALLCARHFQAYDTELTYKCEALGHLNIRVGRGR